ncbi:MAG: WxL domain-containing protein [Patulibacter minatonensis]
MPRTILKISGLVAAAAFSLGTAGTALGAVASEQVNAGSLAFINSTPGNIAFPATTLDGTDQTKTQTQAFDVSDATGSNNGWSITATSTTFTAAGHNLSANATTIQGAPGVACDAGSTCTPASNSVSYPFTMPSAAVAPTAQKMFNAAANTGMGNQTVTPTWSLSVPSTTWAGGAANPYTATWTFTLVSGP